MHRKEEEHKLHKLVNLLNYDTPHFGTSNQQLHMSTFDLTRTQIHPLNKEELQYLLRQFSIDDLINTLSVEDLRKILRKLRETQITATAESAAKEKQGAEENIGTSSSTSAGVDEQKNKITQTDSEDNKPPSDELIEDVNMDYKVDMEFNKNLYTWEEFIMKWELYFVGHAIPAERQTALFLTKSGAQIFRLAIDLCAPCKPAEKSFAELTKLIQEHLSPKKMKKWNDTISVKPSRSKMNRSVILWLD